MIADMNGARELVQVTLAEKICPGVLLGNQNHFSDIFFLCFCLRSVLLDMWLSIEIKEQSQSKQDWFGSQQRKKWSGQIFWQISLALFGESMTIRGSVSII